MHLHGVFLCFFVFELCGIMGQKTILHHLEVVRALSDKRFPSYEHFREEVIFQKCEFAFSWGFFSFFMFERLAKTSKYSF